MRTALRTIRETAPPEAQLAVVALDLGDHEGTYLLRQYLRGRIQALQFDHREDHGCHCGLDRSSRLVRGDYVARVDDTLQFKPGWVEKAVAALEADPGIGCLSLVPPSDYHRGRGRPRTVNVEPIEVDHLDMRCFVARRELLAQIGAGSRRTGRTVWVPGGAARRGAPSRLLAGPANPLCSVEVPAEYDSWPLEEELPPHEGASGALQRLEQAYQLGDDVLLTCLSCGGTELETIAARIRFCERHQVATGFWYELRCPECGELLYKDDYQFRCPD